MQTESVWLGPMRAPVRMALIGVTVATLAMAIWLIGGHFLSAEGISMHEMLRPEGRPQVQIMLWLMFLTLLLASLYLSDFIGSIEPAPTGPLDYLSLVCSRVAMIGVAGIVLVMFYEVVSRYVFEKPTLWANELSLWIAAFVFLLAGLYAMQQRSHIRIYIIYNIMPRWMQKASDVISVFLIWAFTFSLVWGAFNEAQQKFGRMETFGTAWDPPIPATVKPAILIIITLVAIQALSNLITDWKKHPEHHSPLDDVDETEIENIRRTLEEKN
ncbi:TRAP transporter small permease [Aestuariicoccus sp. MJ-SS9]|uniref:TRAP transporter small permease subunit n=1 Tax=Aestuariicoccus sp. MJ-SS9 TaxID=3079855 RepID=UPI0029080F5B|nr:TRAP transporter small permease [Aestuariicoccus sp. MJ-SS9]MDU8909820.1 TRAP transporter small permease [Aestuariicoccus sp. MJ-SS9]